MYVPVTKRKINYLIKDALLQEIETEECPYVHMSIRDATNKTTQSSPDRMKGSVAACYRSTVDTKPVAV